VNGEQGVGIGEGNAGAALASGLGAATVRVDPCPVPRSPFPTLTVDVITDFQAFLNLETEWNDASDRAAVPHPFLRHEWLRTWWECFGARRRLHIIVVRAGGRIAAIAPLMTETVRSYGMWIRKVDLIHNDHTPRAGFIVAAAPEESYRAIWDALMATRDEWDVLQLSRVVRGSDIDNTIARFASESQCPTGVWHGDVSPYLTLTGTWDAYYQSLPGKFRQNLRNRLSRLTKLGEPRLEVLDQAAEIEAARDDAVRLEASGWKRESGTAISSDSAVERFYRSLAPRATAQGWLRLMFLTVGGQRIATSYGACYRDRLFLFKTGYDPAYATCSPFKLLTYLAIQDAYAKGLAEVDFLGDEEPWKLEWTNTSRSHDWLHVFSGTVRARLLHSLKFQMVPELKRRWRA
jgi:CelD/BcsL family acetyltransferase involved in cellulose biosynthesis